MSKDTLSLTLNGEVPLHLFSQVLRHFDALVSALSEEVTGTEIQWEISQLRSGSAVTVIRGVFEDEAAVEKVVSEYEQLAKLVQHRQLIPYSEDVISNVRAITSFINGHITSVELGTSDVHIVITEPLDEQWQEESKQYTFGAITGIVRTISAWTKSYTGQPKIRLAVEDAVFGRVVYCYLNDDQGELARKIWRSRVSITGMIFRDPDTGRPIEVRQVKDVQEVEPSRPKSYKQARGILPWHDGDEPSEVTMRRLRDAK